jgi:predicted permease
MSLLDRMRSVFSGRSELARMEREIEEEVRVHIQNRADDLQRRGLTRDEAQRGAQIEFGSRERFKEEIRETRAGYQMEHLVADTRFGVRMLRKAPGFAAIAVLTLALGIGATTAVFSVVHTILIKPLPYAAPDRIVMVWWNAPISLQQVDEFPWSPREFNFFSKSLKTVESLGAFKSDFFNISSLNEPFRTDGLRATEGFFSSLGIAPELGRGFASDEYKPGHEHEVLLSDHLWRERFGGDSDIVGHTVDMNGESYSVVGVMPQGFTFPHAEEMPADMSFASKVDLWVPLSIPTEYPIGGPNELAVVARMVSGVTPKEVEAEIRVAAAQMEKEFAGMKGWLNPNVVPLTRQVVGDARRPLFLLLAAVAVVLVIASANVASLLLTRSLGRRHELTLRAALGAGRARLIRQLLTESLLLAGMGGCGGIVVAELGIRAARIFGPTNIPRLAEVHLDAMVLVFAIGVSIATGICFGLMPALLTSRASLAQSLNEGRRQTAGSAVRPRMRDAILVLQVALALVLVISAGLLVRTLYRMIGSDSGFSAEHVLTFQLSLPSPKYKETDRMEQLYERALLNLKSAPGVQAAAIVSEVPLGGATDGTVIRVPDHPGEPGKTHPYANYSFASAGYFSVIGTPLLRGRDFQDADTLHAAPVAIINAVMAKKYWPGEDALGRQVGVGLPRWPTRTIVGIIADIKHGSLREQPDPEMYVPYTQNEIKVWPSMQTMQVALRAQGDAAALAAAAREAIKAADPDLPLGKIATMDVLVGESMAQSRFSALLVGSFGGLALLLAMIGMYGAISYSVAQRTQEIGIRMALGAERGAVFGMVVGEGVRLAALGIALGLVAAFGVTRVLASFLYGIQPTDPLTFGVVSVLLGVVALLACYVPAHRAMRVDPMEALRHE